MTLDSWKGSASGGESSTNPAVRTFGAVVGTRRVHGVLVVTGTDCALTLTGGSGNRLVEQASLIRIGTYRR